MTSRLSAYLELTKPKVTLLNLAVGLTCFVLAAFPAVDWTKMHDDIDSFVFGQKGLMADYSMKGGKFTKVDLK